jgi:hypothetical protein
MSSILTMLRIRWGKTPLYTCLGRVGLVSQVSSDDLLGNRYLEGEAYTLKLGCESIEINVAHFIFS